MKHEYKPEKTHKLHYRGIPCDSLHAPSPLHIACERLKHFIHDIDDGGEGDFDTSGDGPLWKLKAQFA